MSSETTAETVTVKKEAAVLEGWKCPLSDPHLHRDDLRQRCGKNAKRRASGTEVSDGIKHNWCQKGQKNVSAQLFGMFIHSMKTISHKVNVSQITQRFFHGVRLPGTKSI
ncbi:hypothetical protein EXN66_Car006881 [Channa argus]|uniref:Uncharacterized protein n=1 Tax=Channa argus TaxID=215402 RepID=A0A6G1PMH1_CHAAH|nr:hypothetical protein EXN66_Car006881 [Channa argus]